jgi:hypothetical protein
MLKGTFILVALMAACLASLLVALALWDVLFVRRHKLNGAIQFMTLDNFRHQVSLLLISLLLLNKAMGFFPIDQITVSLIIVSSLIIDGFCSLGRRHRMAQLVGDYIGLRGGKRRTDPPRCPSPCPPDSYHGSIGE